MHSSILFDTASVFWPLGTVILAGFFTTKVTGKKQDFSSFVVNNNSRKTTTVSALNIFRETSGKVLYTQKPTDLNNDR
jgi:uncharacterized protein YgiB involved in biofilm formation